MLLGLSFYVGAQQQVNKTTTNKQQLRDAKSQTTLEQKMAKAHNLSPVKYSPNSAVKLSSNKMEKDTEKVESTLACFTAENMQKF